MREIKFRAWDKNNNQMCKVNFLKFNKSQYLNVGYRRVINEKIIDDNSLLDDNMYGTCVLMQYTGLHDKNGKEIYEGDIVKDENNKLGYIQFLQQDMGFVIVYEKFDTRLGHRHRGGGYDVDYGLEVIGNIYENPES